MIVLLQLLIFMAAAFALILFALVASGRRRHSTGLPVLLAIIFVTGCLLLVGGYCAIAESHSTEPLLGWAKPWQAAVALAPLGIIAYARWSLRHHKALYDTRAVAGPFFFYLASAALTACVGVVWRACGWLVEQTGVS